MSGISHAIKKNLAGIHLQCYQANTHSSCENDSKWQNEVKRCVPAAIGAVVSSDQGAHHGLLEITSNREGHLQNPKLTI